MLTNNRAVLRSAVQKFISSREPRLKQKSRQGRFFGAAFFFLGRKIMETLRQFAEQHKVRLNDRKHERKFRLATSEDTIHGRYGEIVSDESFGAALAVKFI